MARRARVRGPGFGCWQDNRRMHPATVTVGLSQKRIVRALGADRGICPVTWRDQCLIGQREQFVMDRFKNIFERAAPQVRSANASLEESVACNQARCLACRI